MSELVPDDSPAAPGDNQSAVKSRRRFLAASAALPIIAGAPFVIDRVRSGSAPAAAGALDVRITSIDGRYQALGEPLPTGGSIYAPGGRTRSTIAVRDQLTDTTVTMTLDRNLEPEAFSPDGRTLFAIDHRPADDPVAYRVSTIDVARAIITDTLGPSKIAVVDEMRGTGRQQVMSPLGDQLYTLYILQFHDHSSIPEGKTAHDHDRNQTAAFVHVLDVVDDWALCVDLPEGFGLGPTDSVAIMIDDTGLVITAVDHELGSLVEVTRLPDTGDETGRFAVSAFRPIPG